MSLEKRLTNEPRRFGSSSKLLTFGAVLLGLLSMGVSCGGGGGGGGPKGNPQPVQNRNPVVTSTPSNNTNEGDNYFSRIVASDPDGDAVTYSLLQAPNGMTINGNDGSLSLTNAQEGSFPVSVQMSDNKGGVVTHNFTLTSANTKDNLSGKVQDLFNGNPITTSTTDVVLGHRDLNGNFVADLTSRTNTQGEYSFTRVPTGVNRLVKLSNPNYLEHLAGSLTSNSDLTNVDFSLVPTSFNLSFYNQVARNPNDGGQTQRWLQVPQVYINTSPARGSGRQPTQQEIDLAEMVFRNDASRFNNGFTTNNIQITKGTNPPSSGTPGYIVFFWDDSLGSTILGAHGEFLNGNEIVSAISSVRTGLLNSQQLYVFRQEITQPFGARNDSNLEQSIFNDPQTSGVDNYTTIDLQLGKILYSRPPGNRGTIDGPDSNPDTFRIR